MLNKGSSPISRLYHIWSNLCCFVLYNHIDHRIRNQQVSLNSLDITPGCGQYPFKRCVCMCISNSLNNVKKYKSPICLSPIVCLTRVWELLFSFFWTKHSSLPSKLGKPLWSTKRPMCMYKHFCLNSATYLFCSLGPIVYSGL